VPIPYLVISILFAPKAAALFYNVFFASLGPTYGGVATTSPRLTQFATSPSVLVSEINFAVGVNETQPVIKNTVKIGKILFVQKNNIRFSSWMLVSNTAFIIVVAVGKSMGSTISLPCLLYQ